jgi:two-component system, LytTR family, sensor histidine kinase AlgZ
MIWAAFWVIMYPSSAYGRQLFNQAMWIPAFIFFGYPLVYGAIPHLLLKGRVSLFFLVVLAWGGIGLYIDEGYRFYIYIPIQEAMGLDFILPRGPLASCYLCMTTSAASPMIVKFFKLFTIKQRDWMRTQQERLTAELQLLKAQVHPHFLFSTLNNIYSCSMNNSPKTPDLILKLSSLLSYMLYDCKAEQVRLEKEIEIIKNYIDLEKDRYGHKIEISWSVEGDIKNKFISPLLMLPFLENAFKLSVSEQIEKHWLSVDISVKSDILRCKIANSKNEFAPYTENGIGITNVKKRLEFICRGGYELKLNDEGNFFVVSLLVKMAGHVPADIETAAITQTIRHQIPVPA